ncbi:MAG: helix-turn-helix transcriptional regulator [Betaproteobacteria bacterium]|nr:helix-turn-helix transcriptional regulator [Betaproteobacteria bacterium]
MTKPNELTLRDKQLLELLAAGLPGKDIAGKLGLSVGTTRVYLHNLYVKLGVGGRAAAMVLHQRARATAARGTAEAAAAPHGGLRRMDESAGDIAVRAGLLSSLGAMSCFLGPHARAWEVAVRLKGQAVDDDLVRRHLHSRRLWEALLRADWPVAKQAAEDGAVADLLLASPADYAVACCMLALGGYQVAGAMVRLHESRGGASRMLRQSESNLLRATLERSLSKDGTGQDFLRGQLRSLASNLPFKHLAMVTAFHLCLNRRDNESAADVANALWREAESQRQQLLDLGDDVLAGSVPASQANPPTARAARPRAAVAALSR